MQRHVLHMDLDSFFVSVERLQDRRLGGHEAVDQGRVVGDRQVEGARAAHARHPHGLRAGDRDFGGERW